MQERRYRLSSELLGTDQDRAYRHLADHIANADEDSEFVELNPRLPALARENAHQVVSLLHTNNYDALLLFDGSEDDTIIGHVAFQKNSDGWHVLELAVGEAYRNRGNSKGLIVDLIHRARENYTQRIRLGRGRNQAMIAVYDSVVRDAAELGITPEDNPDEPYWISLSQEAVEPSPLETKAAEE